MDDVQSTGVIYINHNMATEQEADRALNQLSDAQGAKYFQPILIHEPESNGVIRTSGHLSLIPVSLRLPGRRSY